MERKGKKRALFVLILRITSWKVKCLKNTVYLSISLLKRGEIHTID